MKHPKTRKELAKELGIHTRTLYRWLKKNNIELSSGLITPIQQELIYEKLGYKRMAVKI